MECFTRELRVAIAVPSLMVRADHLDPLALEYPCRFLGADGVHGVGGDADGADSGRLGHGHVSGEGPLAEDQFADGESVDQDRMGADMALRVQ